jgi:hypothetical protein
VVNISLLLHDPVIFACWVDGWETASEAKPARMDRCSIYAGQRQFASPCAASVRVRDELWARLLEALGPNPREERDLFPRLAPLRAALADYPLAPLLVGLGLQPAEWIWDRVRLRAVEPGAESNPAAADAFTAHRDTWYANPQSQINLWMPLHDVSEADTFGFYPQRFESPVANDSEQFDYSEFLQLAGFASQRREQKAVFPKLTGRLPEAPEPFALESAGVLFFAAAHLHQTLPVQEQVRFSIDLRLVPRGDDEGAPNVDNRSRGSALSDYRCP